MFNLTPTKIDIVLIAIVLSVIIIAVYVHRKPSTSHTESSPHLGIKDLVDKVQSELIETAKARAAETAMFEVKSFDLEINFILTEREKVGGGLEAKVVTLSDEIESSAQKVQKITLHMETVKRAMEEHPSDSTVDLTKNRKSKQEQ